MSAKRPDVSVVVPVHGNAATLAELTRRVGDTLDGAGHSYEIVLVDDVSPDESREVIARLTVGSDRVRGIELAQRSGQHRALVAGLRAARGRTAVTMDADLQDPPEVLPELLAMLAGADVVFAARRGAYQSRGRMATSRAFKNSIARVAGIPADAGAFMALSRTAINALAAFDTGRPFLPAMAGLLGLPVGSVPIERASREQGSSAYTGAMRFRVGLSALMHAIYWRVRGSGPRALTHNQAHNAAQIDYYAGEDHPNLVPSGTRYLIRQIDRLIEVAGIDADQRVLEVGAGMGRYTIPLAERLPGLEAMDLSAHLLERLRDLAPEGFDVPMHVGDASDPPDGLVGRYDVVIGFFVLHHVHDLAAVMSGVVRMLKPGGRVILLEPNPYNPLYYVQMAVTPHMSFSGDKGMLRMRRQPVARAFADAGLTSFELERFGFWPPFVHNTTVGAATEGVLEVPTAAIGLAPFQLFSGELS